MLHTHEAPVPAQPSDFGEQQSQELWLIFIKECPELAAVQHSDHSSIYSFGNYFQDILQIIATVFETKCLLAKSQWTWTLDSLLPEEKQITNHFQCSTNGHWKTVSSR